MQPAHATPVSIVRTTDLERLYDQLRDQQDALARQADLIATLSTQAAKGRRRSAQRKP